MNAIRNLIPALILAAAALAPAGAPGDEPPTEIRLGKPRPQAPRPDPSLTRAAERFLAAVRGGPAHRYGFALGLQPFQARGGFTEMLDGLLERLREQARSGGETDKVVEAIARVLEARGLAQGNVNPQLVAAVLADDLAEPA